MAFLLLLCWWVYKMKQSTIILLFGIVYAIIALFLNGESNGLSLLYASFSGLTAIIYILVDMGVNKNV